MKTHSQQMIADIEEQVRFTAAMIGRERLDPRVMAAMAAVPRHLFVPEQEERYAYANGPLPIGHGQTISQPYIVALMTDLLECGPEDRVLEVGTGSGYQAAVLSLVVGRVYSVEIIGALAAEASARLARLGYHNLEVRHGDGGEGWPEHAPFDGILVTAAAPAVPPALIEQLAPGARLVIPVGPRYGHQRLLTVERRPDGSLERRDILGVAFVPLVRDPADSAGA